MGIFTVLAFVISFIVGFILGITVAVPWCFIIAAPVGGLIGFVGFELDQIFDTQF